MSEEVVTKKRFGEYEATENQPAPIVKHILAGFFDMIVLFFLQLGLYFLVSLTPINSKVAEYHDECIVIQDTLKLETGYGEKVYLGEGVDTQNYRIYIDEGGEYIVRNVTFTNEEERAYFTEKFTEACNNSVEFGTASVNYKTWSFIIYAVLTGGVLELVYFFVVPLIKNNGQTFGMWICGLRIISDATYDKPTWYQYLFRFLIIYLLGSLLPYFIYGYIATMGVIPAILIITLFTNKKRKTIHDLLTRTMLIEKVTFKSSQDVIDELKEKESSK